MGYRIMDLMEGARNYVINMACAKKGEEVLIFTDTRVDPLVPEALANAAREAGTRVSVMIMGWVGLEVARLTEEDIPNTLKQAVWGADLVIEVTSELAHPNDHWLNVPMMENGMRLLHLMPATVDHLASDYGRFPAEIILAMINKDYEKVRRSKKCRVTDRKGTDITADIVLGPQYQPTAGFGMNRILGKMHKGSFIAMSGIIGAPMPNANGVVYFDLVEVLDTPPVKAPKWEVKDGWVTKVEDAPVWGQMIAEDKRNSMFSELMWAYNPKLDITKTWPRCEDTTRRGGVLHMAMGQPISRASGDVTKASTHKYAHTHGLLLKPTVQVDGETLVEDGHILALDDPDVRKIAAKYGDPDKVLREIPYPDSYVARR